MEQTIYDILTDETARGTETIDLTQQTTPEAGAPWFDGMLATQYE
jgi:hypothetical protein